MRIALDFTTHEARLVAAYTHSNPPLLAASQGNMQTLPDGNTLVGYGGVPAISEFAPDGSLLFDAHLPYDMAFYRAFRYPWSARPASPPAVLASLNNTGEETIVHASWNGATGVASWRVLAGKKPGPLAAQATIPASGFESLDDAAAKVRLRRGAGARRRRPRARDLADGAGRLQASLPSRSCRTAAAVDCGAERSVRVLVLGGRRAGLLVVDLVGRGARR